MNKCEPVVARHKVVVDGLFYRQPPRQFYIRKYNLSLSVIIPCLVSLYDGGARALINYWGLNIPAGGETVKIQLSNCEEKEEGGSSEQIPPDLEQIWNFLRFSSLIST